MKILVVNLLYFFITAFFQSGFLGIVENIENKQEKRKLRLWATYYYIPQLNHDDKGIDLLDKQEKKTGLKLADCDWCKAAIEGTVIVKKDEKRHLLNFWGRSEEMQYDCKKCIKNNNYSSYKQTGKVLWTISKGFGKGVSKYWLFPYKSIAVDKEVIPIGSVIFIPTAKGVKYKDPLGKEIEHDGYFLAVDTGSEIKGNHIDVFIGIEKENTFEFIKSAKEETFEAFIVDDITKKNELVKLHEK